MIKDNIWSSQDGNTRIILTRVEGYKHWPGGLSTTGSPYMRRLEVYLGGGTVHVGEDMDIEELLKILPLHMALSVAREVEAAAREDLRAHLELEE